MSFDQKLESIIKKHQELGEKLSDPSSMESGSFAKISKEYSDLGEIVPKIQDYIETKNSIPELEEMISDPEMKELAEEELFEAKKKLPAMQKEIQIALLPKDEADEKNAILEIRAGTGGDEAALFAGNLLEMYQRYSAKKGWKFEVMSASEADVGGFKEVVANVSGKNVFKFLKV